MAKATVAELDKRLSAHEARCDQRWKENYRRLDSIENGIASVNKTIRNTLLFIVTIFLSITGFLFQEIIYQAIT
ncbi:MAG TPA: hypothetical protein DHV30_02400 [Balneola sp.]|nr:hypothetical protein [Balneola sp.]|tara:strand:+ start:833 stop:1054 length:222 start_codon:yes stop_codon:yes gene_type:complete